MHAATFFQFWGSLVFVTSCLENMWAEPSAAVAKATDAGAHVCAGAAAMGTAADAFATADFANATAAVGAAAEGAAGDEKKALASLSLRSFLEHFRLEGLTEALVDIGITRPMDTRILTRADLRLLGIAHAHMANSVWHRLQYALQRTFGEDCDEDEAAIAHRRLSSCHTSASSYEEYATGAAAAVEAKAEAVSASDKRTLDKASEWNTTSSLRGRGGFERGASNAAADYARARTYGSYDRQCELELRRLLQGGARRRNDASALTSPGRKGARSFMLSQGSSRSDAPTQPSRRLRGESPSSSLPPPSPPAVISGTARVHARLLERAGGGATSAVHTRGSARDGANGYDASLTARPHTIAPETASGPRPQAMKPVERFLLRRFEGPRPSRKEAAHAPPGTASACGAPPHRHPATTMTVVAILTAGTHATSSTIPPCSRRERSPRGAPPPSAQASINGILPPNSCPPSSAASACGASAYDTSEHGEHGACGGCSGGYSYGSGCGGGCHGAGATQVQLPFLVCTSAEVWGPIQRGSPTAIARVHSGHARAKSPSLAVRRCCAPVVASVELLDGGEVDEAWDHVDEAFNSLAGWDHESSDPAIASAIQEETARSPRSARWNTRDVRSSQRRRYPIKNLQARAPTVLFATPAF